MGKIAGVDVLLYVEINEEKIVLGGQSGATLNRTTNIIDTTSKDAGGWVENVAGVNSWGLDCEGFLVTDDTALGEVERAWTERKPLIVEIRLPGGRIYGGKCLISDFPTEFPQDDAASYSLTLTGTGPLESKKEVV
ncbi:phage tail tube protein [Heliorestis convoluta]|uniref:Phage major tail 2 family protein n=1 Tax=Heliorestis convoluta TaxID=356322 RepID=A0A5Q2N1G3_9FIRM|nr:phage tail protein [Heliorestis convoluta]QGG47653.1 phage major tail 2 family protein [Heliorestis convoluta]